MLGTPTPLRWIESAVWIDLALESSKKRGPAAGGHFARVALGVQAVGGQAGAENPLARAHIVIGQRGGATLFAHRRRSPFFSSVHGPGRGERPGPRLLRTLFSGGPHLLDYVDRLHHCKGCPSQMNRPSLPTRPASTGD